MPFKRQQIIQNEFNDPKPDDPSSIFPWRAEEKSFEEVRSLKAIHEFTGEVLIVESEHDDFIPHQTIENYKNAMRDNHLFTYKFLSDADHSLRSGNSNVQYVEILVDWFKNKI
ncbi:MAG TPA: prolyl oligopeptidase family serine peptidase [Candidatus Saccharimonadales bacterium]|nr:prolyl oligopeptidase family serine peptidase [Candidatus Saccharimonadales bacterium]